MYVIGDLPQQFCSDYFPPPDQRTQPAKKLVRDIPFFYRYYHRGLLEYLEVKTADTRHPFHKKY